MSKLEHPGDAKRTATVPAQIGGTQLNGALLAKMIEMRRHLHRNPELSNNEARTQVYVRQSLLEAGIEDVRDAAGYGLSVDIVGTAAKSNRKIAIRADIDALPIDEESGVGFSSLNPGVMHACGHDAHTAMVFATAVSLHNARDSFSGTVRLIFQPAEEAEPLGGRRVVEEGLLDDVDAAVGIHVDPYTPTGIVAVASGPYTLAADTIDITVTGVSAHAAKPSEGVDAIAVACSMVSELQKIVAREIDPYDPLVISITSITGGGSYNVIADRVQLKGTIRSGSEATRQKAQTRVREVLEGVAASHRAAVTFTVIRGEPPVVNDPEMTRMLGDSVTGTFGGESLLTAPGWTAADDFGFYSEKRPSVYFRLGIRNEDEGSVYPLHHPKFRVDEAALAMGATVLVNMATNFLDVDK